jgi:hypothetical protein
MARKRREAPKQLYSLFKPLRDITDDHNNLGHLIGNCVVIGLNESDPASEDPIEIRYSDIREIYAQLENSLNVLISSESSYAALAETIVKVDEMVETEGEPETNTLYRELEVFTGLNPDRLRRLGLGLLEEVLDHGPYNRPVDALNGDYDAVKSAIEGR